MENIIKIGSRVVFIVGGHIKGKTGIVEQVTPDGYTVRLDNSHLKMFNLIGAMKHEVKLV
jgi:ribosomal protein L24